MENIKIRLPKCLTEIERRGILEYNESVLQNFDPNEREGMSKGIFVLRDDRGIFCPYPEYSPWVSVLSLSFEEGTLNIALLHAVQEVLKQTAGGYEWGDSMLFFNRAYAIATHVLNNPDTVYMLKSYLKIWDNHYDTSVLSGCYGVRFSQQNSELCKHICASMVYCILDNEDVSRPDKLLQEIEWLLQASQDGIDTLKVFREEVANIGATEEPPTPSKPKGGRTKEYLFPQEQTPELAAEFVQILYNKGIYNGAEGPSSSERQRIYGVLLSFIKQHQKSVDIKSAASVCRFLTTACGVLKPVMKNGREANNSNFENEIRKLL